MKLNRREALKMGAAAVGASLVPGCAHYLGKAALPELPANVDLPSGASNPTLRLINRTTFGARPGDMARVEAMGREAYVDSLLNPDDSENLYLTTMLARIEVLHMDPMELQDLPEREAIRQLQMAAILPAVYGKHQLKERMVDFWTNHFNIYTRKGLGAYRLGLDHVTVIRKHALGKFPDMLRASAHSPAMLTYLDQQTSVKGHANENYAREIMELHTLGVHGGYTQKDVMEVARCFTGWTVEQGRFALHKGRFKFDPSLHDNGQKVVLGHVIPAGGGQQDAETVIDILVGHPSTAKFISSKLCRHFLGADESPWVETLSQIYLQTGGDIRQMLRPMLLSDDLTSSKPIAKRPFNFIASALRALDANTDCDRPIQAVLEEMGQPLFEWPMPDGFPERTQAWTGSLLARWNFAFALANNQLARTDVDLKNLTKRLSSDDPAEQAMELVLGRKPTRDDKVYAVLNDLDHATSKMPDLISMCLTAPEFQWI